jgi:hypothetical protein
MLTNQTAFWLRSSVVSVLFSLISETVLFEPSYINLIFEPRESASVLAHVDTHCVTGIVLPPVDATFSLQAAHGEQVKKSFSCWCLIVGYSHMTRQCLRDVKRVTSGQSCKATAFHRTATPLTLDVSTCRYQFTLYQ